MLLSRDYTLRLARKLHDLQDFLVDLVYTSTRPTARQLTNEIAASFIDQSAKVSFGGVQCDVECHLLGPAIDRPQPAHSPLSGTSRSDSSSAQR